MTSRHSAKKERKLKNTKKSSPAKQPAVTVASLFKKQFIEQAARNKHTEWTTDDDDEGVTFVKKELNSPYFSPKKSHSAEDLQLNEKGDSVLSGKSAESTSETAKNSDHTGRAQTRLSRRLSLRKASQEKNSAAESGNTIITASCTKDCLSEENSLTAGLNLSTKHSLDPAPQGSTINSDGVNASQACDGSSSLSADTQTKPEEVGRRDIEAPKIRLTNTGKLSLKRKRISQEKSVASPSPPKIHSLSSSCSTSSSSSHASLLPSENKQCESSTDHVSESTQFSNVAASQPQGKLDSSASRPSPSKSSHLAAKASSSSGHSELCQTEEEAEVREEEQQTGSVADDVEENKEENVYSVPYYLENFNTIMKSVFADDYYFELFDETDMKYVAAFNDLSEASQKLYVRLFSRKLAWLSMAKIKYSEIADDLTGCLNDLVQAGLLSSGVELDDLSAVLGAMAAPDLRTLAKSYHINPMGQQKGQIIQALVVKSQQNTVASLFGQKIGGVKTAMLKRAKKMLGPIYRLMKEARAVFVRAMMLFSLINTNGDEDSGSGGQGQMFQMLLVNMGRVVYPTYSVNRHTRIFACRQDVIRFEEALQLESELLSCSGAGNWKGAYSSFLTVREHYEELCKDNKIIDWDRNLPEFLRYFTAGSVLVRLLNHSIEILQRRKDYAAAVALIKQLLGQEVYNLDLHGYWWDRLALNLDVHLKKQEQALQAIEDGLADPLVRTGHRLSLFLRAEALCSKPKSPFRQRLKGIHHEPLIELPKMYVDGRVLPHTLPGSRYQFITSTSYAEGNSEEVTMCNVEQIVLDYYHANGYPQGIHAEGSVVSTLFCLFLWDMLFLDVEDAFHSPYQTTPLDLHTDAFYQQRQPYINHRLQQIENSSEEDLLGMLGDTWEKQYGVMCAGINWERFTSVEEAQGLVTCMGGKVLAGILRRYAQQPRHTRSGFPDLTLWNTDTKRLKVSEVKGPGDRLSHKQMLWLDYLLKLGVDAEVCHVKPVGVKKLKPLTKQEVD